MTDFTGKDKETILQSFGYRITESGTYGALVEDDPEAFNLTGCSTRQEAIDAAYDFLCLEVDPDLRVLPNRPANTGS